MSTVRSGSGAAVGRKGAMGGERRGGKDGGDGKSAKRGEGQVKLLGGESRGGGTLHLKAFGRQVRRSTPMPA